MSSDPKAVTLPVASAPTIIPAQPGFRLAGFACDEPNETKPEDLVPWFEAIIAWLISPTMGNLGEQTLYDKLIGASVMPITPSGAVLLGEGGNFIVDPLGGWTNHTDTFAEADARLFWLLGARFEADQRKAPKGMTDRES